MENVYFVTLLKRGSDGRPLRAKGSDAHNEVALSFSGNELLSRNIY